MRASRSTVLHVTTFHVKHVHEPYVGYRTSTPRNGSRSNMVPAPCNVDGHEFAAGLLSTVAAVKTFHVKRVSCNGLDVDGHEFAVALSLDSRSGKNVSRETRFVQRFRTSTATSSPWPYPSTAVTLKAFHVKRVSCNGLDVDGPPFAAVLTLSRPRVRRG